jgi:hypothetical protein
LDNPRKYQDQPPPPRSRSNAGGTRSKIAQDTLQGEAMKSHLLHNLNQEVGAKYNALADATIGNAIAQRDNIAQRATNLTDLGNTYNMGTPSSSMSLLGYGIHRKHMKGGAIRERGTVGTNGGFVAPAHLPPALVSQPFSANFQFQHTLPPAYQKFSRGAGLYA